MQDLYRGFKKVNEDDSRAVLKHENGHELVIAKSGISKKQKRALDKLPIHQAEGTPIEEEQPQMPEPQLDSGNALKQIGAQITEAVAQKVIEGAEESIPSDRSLASVTPEEMAALQQYSEQQQAPVEPRPEGAPPPGLSSYGTPEQEMAARLPSEPSGFGAAIMEPQAVQEREIAAPGEIGPGILGATTPSVGETEPQPEIEQQRRLDLSRAMQPPSIVRTPEEVMVDPNVSDTERANAFIMAAQNVQTKIEDADRAFREEMRKPENQINPDRFYESMSTGKKIRTMIGIILGGAAGGILRQENPVMAMLNKQIERDIESQKLAQAGKMNLYKQNLEILKDGRAAYFQTSTQLRSIVDMKLQDAKLQLDPNNMAGKTALDAAIAENRLKAQKAKEETAKIEMTKQFERAQKVNPSLEIPDRLDQRLESAVRVTDNKGRSVKLYARNKGAISDLQKRSDAIASAESALRRIITFNNQYGRQLEVPGIGVDVLGEMANAAESLNAEAKIAIVGLLSTGQISERNAKLFEDILPKAGGLKMEDAKQKAAQTAKLLKDMKDLLIQNNLTR